MSKLVPDKIDLAAKALRDVTVPVGPPPEVLAATVAAGKTFEADIHTIIAQRRRSYLMKYIVRIAAAIVLAACLGLGAYVIFVHGTTVAFAQVRDLVQNIQTMTCREHMSIPASAGGPAEADTRSFYSLPHFMRQEATATVAGKKTTQITIFDMDAGKMLALRPDEKVAQVVNVGKLPPELQTKQKQNFAEKMKTLVQNEGKRIGQKKIDGTPAVGFRVTDKDGSATDIWVDDPKGEKVLLVETDIPGGGHFETTDIVINPTLDPSLFSTAVPPGYRELPAMDMSLQNIVEDDLTAGLRLLVENNDNTFPATPNFTLKIMQNAMKKLQPPAGATDADKAKSVAAGKDFGVRVTRMMLFQALNHDTFNYVGDGVKLGDAKAPICWYKPKDKTLYRVIYGDLHVADIAEAELPKPATNRPAQEKPQGNQPNQ